MSRGPFYDGPSSCHSEQGANLARPLRIVLDASKNSSMGLDSRVDVERHCLKYEDIHHKSLHKREISIIQLNRSERYDHRCKPCGVVIRVQILVL
jgi:hypothetical protein